MTESHPSRTDVSAARTGPRELNAYEANRTLFEELDRETKAASEAMRADDMDAWNTHAGRAAELQEEIAIRLGWRTTPPRCDAMFETVPPGRRNTTHTCDRDDGHDGAHHCPACGTDWQEPDHA